MQRDSEGLVDKGTLRRDLRVVRGQPGVTGKAFQVEGVTRAKALGVWEERTGRAWGVGCGEGGQEGTFH